MMEAMKNSPPKRDRAEIKRKQNRGPLGRDNKGKTMRNQNLFHVITEKMTHFDCRDIEDLISSRERNDDGTPTTRVWDKIEGRYVDNAPEICWDKEKHKKSLAKQGA